MTELTWPTTPPAHGSVFLRPFTDDDAHLAVELGTDPYIPLIGSLPAFATPEQGLDWVRRQHDHVTAATGYPFAVADAESGVAIGTIGLGLRHLAEGWASAGYAVTPARRGRGVGGSALTALTAFAWTLPAVDRIELRIEPWNTASIRVAETAGYRRERVLSRHQEIGGELRDVLLYSVTRP